MTPVLFSLITNSLRLPLIDVKLAAVLTEKGRTSLRLSDAYTDELN